MLIRRRLQVDTHRRTEDPAVAVRRKKSQKLVGKRYIDEGVVLKITDVDPATGECVVVRRGRCILYPPEIIEQMSPVA